MTDQPTKTKQQLLAELESIMSMLDDDAVIPTLDTVVAPESKKSLDSRSVQGKQNGSAPTSVNNHADESVTDQNLSPEVAADTSTKPQGSEQRQQLNAELDSELREAMEIDIKIPEVNVPNSQTLFGSAGDFFDDNKEDKETNNLNEASFETTVEATTETTRSPVIETSAVETPVIETPVAPTSEQQNPFPAPSRKPHLFNGEAEAKEPLPGQQHLFDGEPNEKETLSPEASKDTTSADTTEETATDNLTETTKSEERAQQDKPTEKPANPFKSSKSMGSAYPPATLLSSMRRQEQPNILDRAIEPKSPPLSMGTLDRADEPSAGKQEPSASKQEPSADKQAPSADLQKPSATINTPSAGLNALHDSAIMSDSAQDLTVDAEYQPDLISSTQENVVPSVIESSVAALPEHDSLRDDAAANRPHNAEALIEELIEEYLPKLEAELRRRLMASLDSQLDL